MASEKILIAGGSGLVGKFLSQYLTNEGYEVAILGRKKKKNSSYRQYTWDMNAMTMEEEAVTQADYIINLAGAGIADQRWTRARKRVIIDSRIKGNQLIRQVIEKTGARPKGFLGASAIGIYGDRGDEQLTEESSNGTSGFMVDCCEQWEASSQAIADLGIRTAIYRIGIVLSTKGGALEKILLSFKLGVGSYFGNGQQYYSWIHIEDLARMFLFGIQNENVQGVFNAVAPVAITNKEMTLDIKAALQSRALPLPAPAFVLKATLGEMAKTVLNSNRVVPTKFQESGFEYRFTDVKGGVADLVKRKI